jgi:hypothetical protein
LVSLLLHLMLEVFFVFLLLSFVLLYVSCNCYCWFSAISPIVRTRPWTFNTEQVPFRCFHLMTEAEPVSETLCRYFYKLFVCVPLCVCVYFILVFWPTLRVVVCE